MFHDQNELGKYYYYDYEDVIVGVSQRSIFKIGNQREYQKAINQKPHYNCFTENLE